MGSVLVIASSTAHTDASHALRLGDWATALSSDGWRVDVLVRRKSALVQASLPAFRDGHIEVHTLPPVPFGWRHIAIWRAARLVAANAYDLVLGLGDGGVVARAADRTTLHKFPYMVEVLRDTEIDRKLVKAMKHAACVAVPDEAMLPGVRSQAPKARICAIGEPRYDDASVNGASFAEFRKIVLQTRDYAIARFKRNTKASNQ